MRALGDGKCPHFFMENSWKAGCWVEYTLVALVGGEKQEMQPEERIIRWKDEFPH
jgi:hypothetical protein